jgi:MFS family permease
VSQPADERIPFGVKALLAALGLSAFAVVGQITIIGKQVYDLTGSELDLGLLGLAEFIPVALLSPFTGTTADRFDRRKVYAAGLAGEAATSFALFLYIRNDPTEVWPIFVMVFAFGVARAFVAPASRALPIDLAPPSVLERVIALRSVAFQLGIIAGPVIAGFVFVLGPEYPYVLAMVAFGLAAAMLLLVPRPATDRLRTVPGGRQVLRDALEGLSFVRRQPIVRGAISLDLFAVLFGSAVALLPAIAEDRLGVGAVGLGWLRAAVGIGAGATAVALAVRPVRRHIGPVLFGVVTVFGLMTIVVGLSTSYVVVFVALFILAAADSVSVFIRASVVPLATPENMRGRVLAVENVFIGASNELGAVESGVAAYFVGLVGAVVTGGIGTLVVVALWWRWFPELRGADRFADVRYQAAAGGAVTSGDDRQVSSEGVRHDRRTG